MDRSRGRRDPWRPAKLAGHSILLFRLQPAPAGTLAANVARPFHLRRQRDRPCSERKEVAASLDA
jgi:hypothetical protein